MKPIFRHHKFSLLFFFIPWGVYFLFLWSHMLFYKNGNLMAGHPYVWADWSMHIALAANFAFRPVAHWFDSLPVFANADVTYPFVTNLISGLLWKSGLSLPAAFILPSLLWTGCSLVALFVFFRFVLRSEKQAVFAATTFLCSGGLGSLLILREKGIQAFFDSTQILTQVSEYHIDLNSIVPSMFIPQRAFLLGLPLGILILWIVLNEFIFHWKKLNTRYLIVAGICAGLMPIIHSHTFLLIVLFSFWIFVRSYQNFQRWMYFGVPATLLSLLVYFMFLHKGISVSSFFSLNLGWSGKGSLLHWCLYWLENWGIFLPLAGIGTVILVLQKKYSLVWVVSFFWFLFLLSNIIQFQPQEWDNTKMFAWVYLGLSIPVTVVITALARYRFRLFSVVGVLLCSFILLSSGAIDLLHNLDFEHKTFQMLSADQIALGTIAREQTDAQAVFVTRPIVSNPISMIGGRSVYLGYPGWAFSYGLNYSQREADIDHIFSGTLNISTLQQTENVRYVFIEKYDTDTDWIVSQPTVKKIYENSAGVIYKLE